MVYSWQMMHVTDTVQFCMCIIACYIQGNVPSIIKSQTRSVTVQRTHNLSTPVPPYLHQLDTSQTGNGELILSGAILETRELNLYSVSPLSVSQEQRNKRCVLPACESGTQASACLRSQQGFCIEADPLNAQRIFPHCSVAGRGK